MNKRYRQSVQFDATINSMTDQSMRIYKLQRKKDIWIWIQLLLLVSILVAMEGFVKVRGEGFISSDTKHEQLNYQLSYLRTRQ